VENAAKPATAFRTSVAAAAVPSALPSLPQLPFLVILLVAAAAIGLTVAVSLTATGGSDYVFPVKVAIVILVAIAAISAIIWKPAIFPIAAYLFAVPFDNLLQTGGGTVTKMLGGASVIVALLVIVGDRRRTLTPAPAVLAWLAFVAWSVVSLSWSIGLADSYTWLTMVLELFALFAIFSTFRIREDEVRVLVWAIIAGGVACSAYGIWLYHIGTMVASSGVSQLRLDIHYGSGANGSSGSINADHFAGALVLPIALALAVTLRLRGLQKWIGWAALLILFGGVFVSGTRSAVIAIGLLWLYLMIFSPYGRKLLVAMGVAAMLASLALPTVWLRFADPTEGAGNGRFDIWSIGWDAFRTHWLAGSGAGDFRDAYTAAFLKAYQLGGSPPLVQDAHNMIVSTSVELGLIGLVLLAAAWFFQFRSVSRIKRSSKLFDLRLATEAGMVGLCFTALTVDILYFKYLWIGFMIAVLVRNASVCDDEARGRTGATAGSAVAAL
jgi:hypothetical protein